VKAVDNCDPNPTVDFIDYGRKTGDCKKDGYNLLMYCGWTAKDKCGNTSKLDIYIKVTDKTKPVFTSVPADLTLTTCNTANLPTIQKPSATDNCDNDLTFTFTDSQTPITGGNGCGYLITRTWTATDDCGNFAVANQKITITDNEKPVLASAPADVTVTNGIIPVAAQLTATDNCGTPTVTSKDVTVTQNTCNSVITRTWTATDACGNTATTSQLITVQNSVNATPGAVTAETCTGNDGAASFTPASLTYAWSDGGSGASRNNLKAGSYTVTVSDNGCSKTYTVTIPNGCVCVDPVASVTSVDATCGDANGTASVTTDNNANYSFSWSTGATGTTIFGLAPGSYSLTVKRNGIANCTKVLSVTIANTNANCCKDFITATSVVRTLTDCNAKADVCIEIPFSTIANYTITLDGAPYTGTTTSCTNNGTNVQVAKGTHKFVFTNKLGCKDSIDVKVVCIRDIVHSETIYTGNFTDYCLNGLGLGNITSIVNNCPGTGKATFAINNTSKCVKITGLTVGTDSACLVVCNDQGDCINIKVYANIINTLCPNFLTQDVINVSGNCTAGSTLACVDVTRDGIDTKYDIFDNGKLVDPFDIEGCKFENVKFYNVGRLLVNGPIKVTNWKANGKNNSGTVSTITELVNIMKGWDPQGNWTYNSADNRIVLGDTTRNYDTLAISINATNYYLTLERQTIPKASNFRLTSGSHSLVFVDKQNGCKDSVQINIACVTPTYITKTVYISASETICLATNELKGKLYQITNACEQKSGEKVRFGLVPASTCITATGVEEGTEYACFVLSDDYGFTDTTYVTLHVLARKSVIYPVAVKDAATTRNGRTIIIDVLKNDTIHGTLKTVTIVNQPANGKAIVTGDNKILYTPNKGFCSSFKPEEITYMLCTSNGCSVANALVTVLCDEITIFNALSPNNDGVNDNLIIEGLQDYPNNKIQIFNRWGNIVFNTEGYHNEFDGNWNGTALPDGTYFYILEDGEGKSYSGYIQIKR
jgi:gliding motility-associated-like protein